MLKKLPRCKYRGRVCVVLGIHEDGTVRIATSDGLWAIQDGGWERTDKYEWEKTVPKTEVEVVRD